MKHFYTNIPGFYRRWWFEIHWFVEKFVTFQRHTMWFKSWFWSSSRVFAFVFLLKALKQQTQVTVGLPNGGNVSHRKLENKTLLTASYKARH